MCRRSRMPSGARRNVAEWHDQSRSAVEAIPEFALMGLHELGRRDLTQVAAHIQGQHGAVLLLSRQRRPLGLGHHHRLPALHKGGPVGHHLPGQAAFGRVEVVGDRVAVVEAGPEIGQLGGVSGTPDVSRVLLGQPWPVPMGELVLPGGRRGGQVPGEIAGSAGPERVGVDRRDHVVAGVFAAVVVRAPRVAAQELLGQLPEVGPHHFLVLILGGVEILRLIEGACLVPIRSDDDRDLTEGTLGDRLSRVVGHGRRTGDDGRLELPPDLLHQSLRIDLPEAFQWVRTTAAADVDGELSTDRVRVLLGLRETVGKALNDRGGEQSGAARCGQVVADAECAERLPGNGDLRRITAELGDVRLHPSQRLLLVLEAVVPGFTGLSGESGMAEIPEDAEPVIQADHHDPTLADEFRAVVLITAAVDPTATVDEDEDRCLVAFSSSGRALHIQEQAVLLETAPAVGVFQCRAGVLVGGHCPCALPRDHGRRGVPAQVIDRRRGIRDAEKIVDAMDSLALEPPVHDIDNQGIGGCNASFRHACRSSGSAAQRQRADQADHHRNCSIPAPHFGPAPRRRCR